MVRVIKIISILGFIICLIIMYMTDHGIRGIQAFDNTFRLLDMRFHYNSNTVSQTCEQIGEVGRIAYQKYLILDFIFIVCFFIIMLSLSHTLIRSKHVKSILYIVCGLRALFDIVENILLFHILSQYPIFNATLATICSYITSLKFIMLYIWLLLLSFTRIML